MSKLRSEQYMDEDKRVLGRAPLLHNKYARRKVGSEMGFCGGEGLPQSAADGVKRVVAVEQLEQGLRLRLRDEAALRPCSRAVHLPRVGAALREHQRLEAAALGELCANAARMAGEDWLNGFEGVRAERRKWARARE
eukprot:6191865-Pleurochrysis_carterae.AAC.1